MTIYLLPADKTRKPGDLNDPSQDDERAGRARPESSLRAGVQRQRPQRCGRAGRRRPRHGVGGRTRPACRAQAPTPGTRPRSSTTSLRRGGHRRAGARHPGGRGSPVDQGGLCRHPRGPEHHRRDRRRLSRGARGGLHAQPFVVGREPDRALSGRFRELVLPQTTVLVGNHSTCGAGCCRTGTASVRPVRATSPQAAGEFGVPYTLVTGMVLPEQFIDNVLASPQSVLANEKYERLEAVFAGAGDTLLGRPGRPARQRHRPRGRDHRGAGLHGPLPRRGLPPRHGPCAARPPVLGRARGRRRR